MAGTETQGRSTKCNMWLIDGIFLGTSPSPAPGWLGAFYRKATKPVDRLALCAECSRLQLWRFRRFYLF